MLFYAQFDRFSKSSIIKFLVFSILYFSWFTFAIGLQQNNIHLYIAIGLLYFVHPRTRQFLYCFAPFILFVILYDSLRPLHNLNIAEIHIKDLYDLDKSLFGITSNGEKLSLNEYAIQHRNSILDFLSGAFYLSWVPFPILFGFYMFIKKRYALVFNFWTAFLITNLIGFLAYIFYPAAPPWYYFQYGTELIKDTIGNPAGLAWFDELLGVTIFKDLYSQSANVFGAMPSLHAAYPMILSYYSFKNKNKILSLMFLCTMVGIWVAAVYTTHHYMLDVIMGIVCGLLGIFLSERWVIPTLQSWFQYKDTKP